MALTGIEIFKLLPKTNCGECGVPTCLAFAMSLAAGKAELSQMPPCLRGCQEQAIRGIGAAYFTGYHRRRR